jgi:uncharacterized damage-inducible protein DinB
LEREFQVESLSQELYTEFSELKRQRSITDQEISDWVATLSSERLSETLIYTSYVNPEKKAYSIWVAIVHFFNHQTHHRGQLTTLLSQCDLDPGVTDLISLPDL